MAPACHMAALLRHLPQIGDRLVGAANLVSLRLKSGHDARAGEADDLARTA